MHPKPWRVVVRHSDWGTPDTYVVIEDANGERVATVDTVAEAKKIVRVVNEDKR